MSILQTLFGGTPAVVAAPTTALAAPVATPTPPGNIPTAESIPAVGGVIPASAVPVVPTPEAAEVDPNDPLAAYASLWENKPDDNNAISDTPVQLDPAALRKVVAQGDFAGGLTPEVLQKVAAGGDEAMAALPELLNVVAQNTMVQATLAANKLIEKRMATMQERYATDLPGLIKKHTLAENLVDKNPMLSDPAIAPLAEMVQTQLAVKHPAATSQQLTEMTANALSAMGAHFTAANNSQDLTPSTTAPQGEPNWDDWVASGPTS